MRWGSSLTSNDVREKNGVAGVGQFGETRYGRGGRSGAGMGCLFHNKC